MRWTKVVNDDGTNGTVRLDTAWAREAQVTVWGSTGSPDGTVTVYHATPGTGAPAVELFNYATPTTAKTYTGPTGAALEIALTGNTTGKVSVVVGLR